MTVKKRIFIKIQKISLKYFLQFCVKDFVHDLKYCKLKIGPTGVLVFEKIITLKINFQIS